ncbi:DUF4233 domain-containing protein [Pseudoclavibacter sp. CFCC 14310]|nr:DUF4233 domain-containing protein [Pseudoclavibacter sp. CFCC 14310]KAB1645925.1 DUF4233 domain-containing protein [Pseudoclavibacter sp. CFCC 14310]
MRRRMPTSRRRRKPLRRRLPKTTTRTRCGQTARSQETGSDHRAAARRMKAMKPPNSADGAAPSSGVRLRQKLCSVMLGFESFVIIFYTLVLFGLRLISSPLVWWLGAGSMLLLVLALACMRRGPIGLWLGWAVQVVLLLAGLFSGFIFFVSLICLALWIYIMVAAARADREAAAVQHEQPTQH